jgi:hypothetical protein
MIFRTSAFCSCGVEELAPSETEGTPTGNDHARRRRSLHDPWYGWTLVAGGATGMYSGSSGITIHAMM